jgi:PA domain-containing protein
MNRLCSVSRLVRLLSIAAAVAACLAAASRPSFAAATVVVVNVDGPGEGFNDPTPVPPVGGNAGTTRGAQRLIAFQHAADLWGATLDSPVTIIVQASFDPLGANVLGSAGPTAVFAFANPADSVGRGPGFYPGVEFGNTWYGSALMDKRLGTDAVPLFGGPAGFPDIQAQFSSDFNFYLGLDNNHGAQNDLVTVVLHELGHGLNFLSLVNPSTGQNLGGRTDIYARHLLDNVTGLHWNEMTDAQRAASATRFGGLVWDGLNVSADLPQVLVLGSPEVKVLAPAVIAGQRQFGIAAFGPRIGSPNVSGLVVAAVDAADAAGPATTDGCSPLTNAAAVAGKIALIERGACGFAVKARNATNAGALAVIIYNNAANAANPPPGMADDGINGAFVTIPAVSVTRNDGLAILGQTLVSAAVGVDPHIRAGADASGRARLYAPFPVSGGSSVSHYDTVAFKNLLMEPAINADLTHNLKAPDDLTLELLRDIGWFPDADLDGVADAADCRVKSDFRPTIIIGNENTGVPNVLFSNGCTTSDLIANLHDEAKNHGQFVSGVAHLTNDLKDQGLITGAQKGAIQSAAAHTK